MYLGAGYHRWYEYSLFPVSWPCDIYVHFFGFKDYPVCSYLRADVWIAGIVGNLFLYTLLVFLVLRVRDVRRLN